MKKTQVIVYGRFNCPTISHETLWTYARTRQLQYDYSLPLLIVTTSTHDKNNLLTVSQKVSAIRNTSKDAFIQISCTNFFDRIIENESDPELHQIIICGPDRFETYSDIMKRYTKRASCMIFNGSSKVRASDIRNIVKEDGLFESAKDMFPSKWNESYRYVVFNQMKEEWKILKPKE